MAGFLSCRESRSHRCTRPYQFVQMPKTSSYKNKNCVCENKAQHSKDSTNWVTQSDTERNQLHCSCCAVFQRRDLRRNLSSLQRVKSKSSTQALLAKIVSLPGRFKKRQVLSLRVPTLIETESGQEQFVPCSAMDFDPYCDPISPARVLFDDSDNFYVATSADLSLRPQHQFESRGLSEGFQSTPSTSSSYYDGLSTFNVHVSDAQQQSGNNPNESGSRFECLPPNLPELNDLVDDGENSEPVQQSNADSSTDAFQSSLNNLQPISFDPNLVLAESSIDVAELDQYLNTPEGTGNSEESLFGTIIREDQYENLVAVELDHSYGSPSSSNQRASFDLDPSILNEFLIPLDQPAVQMKKCDYSELAVSPSYTETFTNLEPFLDTERGGVLQQQEQCLYGYAVRENSGTLDSRSSVSNGSATTSFNETTEYRIKRDRNNIASQKSRKKRQDKFRMLQEEEVALKRRNVELVSIVNDLERQVKDFKEIMMKAIVSQ